MLLFFRLQLRRAGRSPVDFACFSDRGMKNATTGLQRNRGTKYKTRQKLPFLKGKYLDSSHSQPTADYSQPTGLFCTVVLAGFACFGHHS